MSVVLHDEYGTATETKALEEDLTLQQNILQIVYAVAIRPVTG